MLAGVSLFSLLLITWGIVTAAFLAVMTWKSFIGLREEDVVILDPAEFRQAEDQQQLVARIERLTRWAKTFGFASLTLLLLVGGVWAYRGYLAFSGVQTP
jgi:uncharacterized membrane protein